MNYNINNTDLLTYCTEKIVEKIAKYLIKIVLHAACMFRLHFLIATCAN